MNELILKTANDYQRIDRQIKELQAKQKPLKEELLTYAKANTNEFDSAFQLKFPNGTYISQRVSDIIEGTKENKEALLKEIPEDLKKTEPNEKAILAAAPKNARLRKLLTKFKLKIAQKEFFAVFAG